MRTGNIGERAGGTKRRNGKNQSDFAARELRLLYDHLIYMGLALLFLSSLLKIPPTREKYRDKERCVSTFDIRVGARVCVCVSSDERNCSFDETPYRIAHRCGCFISDINTVVSVTCLMMEANHE